MSQSIRILTIPAESDTVAKGGIARSATLEAAVANVDLAALKASLAELRAQIAQLLDEEEQPGGFRLKQISAGIEINAEGGVSLIGSLKAGAKAAVTLTFERG